jgi:ABC-type transport system involved in multi-copper enzyme maturation permease subunit
MFIVPFIGSQIFSEGAFGEASFDSFTLAMQNQMVMGLFIIMTFLWTAGIPLVLLAAVTCGDFISKEHQDGTLVLLISKPVKRFDIIIGKFVAFMLSTLLLQLIAVLLTVVVIHSSLEADIFILDNMLSLVPSVFAYSIFVALVFGMIATSFSCLFKSRIKAIIVLVALTILIYFGFMTFRGWFIALGYYKVSGFSYLDVNYHLGNTYLYFLQSSGFRLMPIYQGILGQFTGTFEASDPGKLFDADLRAMPPTLEPKNYNSPFMSLIIWLILASVILAFGILRFERKEIT